MPQHFPAHGIQSRIRNDGLCLFPCALVIDEIDNAWREALLEFGGELRRDVIDDFDMREQTVRGGSYSDPVSWRTH